MSEFNIFLPACFETVYLFFWSDPFSTYAKLSKKATFLPPDTLTYVDTVNIRKLQFWGSEITQ